ncbi:MAG: phenylalanine--tRNA ligase beta subunit-related protein [Nitrososphaerota archaeon]
MEVNTINIEIDKTLLGSFPGIDLLGLLIKGLRIRESSNELEEAKKRIYEYVRKKYSLETLKDVPTFRAYRDFFWRIGIDPTKMRPSSEALVRRILLGKELPRINTLVDAYNLASIESEITMAAFDASKIVGQIAVSFARPGEEFLGIGMEDPITLRGEEVVIRDNSKILSIYPYRDSEYSKVGLETTESVLLICGVPGISRSKLQEATEIAVKYIRELVK